MSSEYIKHNGQKVKKSSVMSRGKRYRYNKSGSLEEVTDATALTADDFVISGSKSTLRRISDIEQNVAMIYTRLTTSDGTTETATSEDSDDVAVGRSGRTTRFKGDVKFEGGIDISSSRWSNNVSNAFANAVINKSDAYVNVSVSNDTLTFTTGDGATKSVTTSDANTNKFISGLSFNTGNGVLTATRNDGGTVTTDLDGRYVQRDGAQTITGNLTLQSATPEILFNGTSDTGVDMSIKATPEGLDFYEPEDGNKVHFQILDDTGVNAPYGYKWNGQSLDDRYQAKGSYASSGTTITAGNGLTGGGSLGANRTINVGGGNGITVSADGVAMSGSYTGTFTASGDVCAYSDASLKTNVKTIEGALDKVAAVRGVTFDRIADGSTSAGVIAQELEEVLPEAVKTDEEGVKMVAYGNITGLLIEAVKELSAQVEELKAKK